jgi:hypothetical protein
MELMSSKDVPGAIPYPHPPPGIPRMQHLPTVEGSIRYWEAVRLEAARDQDAARQETAAALRQSYEAARRELLRSTRAPDAGTRDPG